MENKLKLYGFNNLTKSLSFNIYDVCYAKTARSQQEYIAYVDEQYNSERITDIMTHVTEMIGAQVLSMSRQDYDPQGASATFLIADDTMVPAGGSETVAHLDKSHVTVHTYPEFHPDTSIATFRVDRIYEVPTVLQDKAVPKPKQYSIGDFAEKAFQLFDSEHARVQLLCENSMMNTVIDHFGDKIKTQKADEGHFRFTAEVSVSPTFFAWVFMFGGKIRIISPQSVKEAYGELVGKAMK